MGKRSTQAAAKGAAPARAAARKVVPRGEALRRTDAELDDMTSAAATEKLAEGAAEDWLAHAPRPFTRLLDGQGTP